MQPSGLSALRCPKDLGKEKVEGRAVYRAFKALVCIQPADEALSPAETRPGSSMVCTPLYGSDDPMTYIGDGFDSYCWVAVVG